MSDELDVRIKSIIEADEAASVKRIKGQMPSIENGIKDKPIKVSVEMNESSSAKSVKGQFKNLEAALKSKPIKVTLGVDIAASMRAIKAAIPEIQNAFKGAPIKIPFVVDPKAAAKAAREATKAADEAAKKATSSSKGGTSIASSDYQARILQKRVEGLKYAESKAKLPEPLDWSGFEKAFNTGDIKAARAEFRLLSLDFSNFNKMVRGNLDNQIKDLPLRISGASTAASELINKFASLKSRGGIIPEDAISRIEVLKGKLTELANVKVGEGDTRAYLETFRELEGELKKVQAVYKETYSTFRTQQIDIGADKLQVSLQKVQERLIGMRTLWGKAFKNTDLQREWQGLFDTATNGSIKTEAQMRLLTQSIGVMSEKIKGAGLNQRTFLGQIGQNIQKFTQWFAVGTLVAGATRELRAMVDAVKAVDTSLTSLRKVTDETDATYSKFLSNASQKATQLGTTISSLIDSATIFARIGYSLKDAYSLGEIATIYANVGDGVSSVEDASNSIISTMAGFKLGVSDAASIVDKFNNVGNKFAITSGGIGEALRRSAAAMATANTSLDETIGLIASANTVVQDTEAVGTALKTISLRVRSSTSDLEDMGEEVDEYAKSTSKLQSELKALTGVDIMKNANEYKSVFQMLEEISKVYGDLTDVSRANVLEILFGKRQANIGAAILGNFDIAANAMQASMDSAGSAQKEYQKWLTSVEAKQKQSEAAFQGFSNSIMSSDLIKGTYDSATGILGFLTTLADRLGALPVLATAAAAALSFKTQGRILPYSTCNGAVA